jgi:hypothetical protein
MLARPDRLAEIGHGKITMQHEGGHSDGVGLVRDLDLRGC